MKRTDLLLVSLVAISGNNVFRLRGDEVSGFFLPLIFSNVAFLDEKVGQVENRHGTMLTI